MALTTEAPETALAPAPGMHEPTNTTEAPFPAPAEAEPAPTADGAPYESPAKLKPVATPTHDGIVPATEPTPAPTTDATPATQEISKAPETSMSSAAPEPAAIPVTEKVTLAADRPTPSTNAITSPPAPANVNETSTKEEKTEKEEPQNALTKKFTQAEWKALTEFRVRSLEFPFFKSSPEY
jgi:hypothetical protein